MFHNLTCIFILLCNVETTHGFKNDLKKGQKNSQGTLPRETRSFLFPLVICSGYVVAVFYSNAPIAQSANCCSIIYNHLIGIFTGLIFNGCHLIPVNQQVSPTIVTSYWWFPWCAFVRYYFSFFTYGAGNYPFYFFCYHVQAAPPS